MCFISTNKVVFLVFIKPYVVSGTVYGKEQSWLVNMDKHSKGIQQFGKDNIATQIYHANSLLLYLQ